MWCCSLAQLWGVDEGQEQELCLFLHLLGCWFPCRQVQRVGGTVPLDSDSQHPESCGCTQDLNVETINTLVSSSLSCFSGI